MAIPLYMSNSKLTWRNAGRSMFKQPKSNNFGEVPTIFGYNQIKGSRPMSAGCCRFQSTGLKGLTNFYPTIWSHPLETILIKKLGLWWRKKKE